MKEKVLFWIGGPDIHFCMAENMSKKNKFELNAIIDITNRPKKFFEQQKFVNFKKTMFYHDKIDLDKISPDLEYLSYFEKKYDIDLWKLALNERVFYQYNQHHNFSNDEILSILEQECKFFEETLDQIKPDYFISYMSMLHHHHLLYELCKKKGIKIIMLSLTMIGYRCILSQTPNSLDPDSFNQSIPIDNLDFNGIKKYLELFNFSKQIKSYQKKKDSYKLEFAKAGIEFFLRSDNSNSNTHYTHYGRKKSKVLINTSKLLLAKKQRWSFIQKNFLTDIIPNEKFIYFPLNMEQERNTLIAAPYYTDPLEMIKNIARSLPIGYKLYVKEHPTQASREWRKISLYKEMMKIPTVRLYHPDASLKEIYENCSLVISLGGAPGFEAACYGKSSIIFSDTDYLTLPSVIRAKNIEDLPKLIKKSLTIDVSPSDVEKYIKILEKNSFSFDWLDFQLKEAEKFFFGGNLLDVNISNDQMKDFIKENSEIIENISNEHIKKIDSFS